MPTDWTKLTPEQLAQKLSETFSRVRLGRGVVARTGNGMLALLAVWGVIAWRWSDNLIADAGLLIIGIAATAVYWGWMKSTQNFAERNPAQAMLEGADRAHARGQVGHQGKTQGSRELHQSA